MRVSFLTVALWLTAFCLPISLAATNGALALLTLALLLRARRDGAAMRAAWRAEPALAAVAIYILAGAISAAFGTGFFHSLHDCLKDSHRLWSLGLFVAAFALEPETAVWPALAFAFTIVAGIGVVQSLTHINQYGDVARAHAFVHPVTYGEQLALAVLGALCWLARPRSESGREYVLTVAFTTLCAAALALSQTRAALLALVVGAAVIAWRAPRARPWAKGAFALGAVGAAFAEWVRHGRAVFGDPSASGSTRYVLWRAAWRMFLDHPLAGVGPGHYRTLFERYVNRALEGEADWGSAHNLYLHQLAERGLIGAAALGFLLWMLAVRAFRAEQRRGERLTIWAAASVPAFLVMNVTETALQTEQFATLFLLIWAAGVARGSREEIL